jgi:hypothetical protein
MKHLTAALAVLGGDGFRCGEEWFGETSAVLEFFAMIDGVDINGVSPLSEVNVLPEERHPQISESSVLA